MTNPNNSVGTNAGFNGRTTPKAFNDVLSVFSRGVISGWECSPSSGMTVSLGGGNSERDVAIAEDNAGNKTSINNRLQTPISITLDGAPSTNSRIDAIVAYAEASIQGLGQTDVDFPSGVGLIAVSGATAANPVAPDDTAIRDAITADGATGSNAFYVVLAKILVGTNVTTIGSGAITQGDKAQLNVDAISDVAATIEARAQTLIDNFKASLTLTNFTTYSVPSNAMGSNLACSGTINLAQSADSSVFKVYGTFVISNSANASKTGTLVAVPGLTGKYGVKSTLKLTTVPTEAFQVDGSGVAHYRASYTGTAVMRNAFTVPFAVGSDGFIYLYLQSSNSITVEATVQDRAFYPACLYFNTNFGDSES